MAKRSRKRKLDGEDEAETKWELTNILNTELREEMATMWELPQIFHFLHVSNEALNIPHLSMYEMERMLAMPQASKQLANIMTCLLSPPVPKTKIRKIPPMPYDFWVNVLTHKVKGWFKVYQSKHQDVTKVFDAIGVEPEFWRNFPEVSIIDEKPFEALSFKQRVWILKTLCDTVMYSRKTVQDAMSSNVSEDQYEIVLGADRYGAKYFYFPLFLENDLRVYRHSIDNTILSTVRPPPWKATQISSTKQEKNRRSKRKRCRWQNGSLPRERKRSKKIQDEEIKMSGDSAIGSSVNEDTNFSGTSTCSNNNNIVIEAIERNRSRSPSKNSEEASGESRSVNPKSSGYDSHNSMSDGKSLNDTEEMFRGFASNNDRENSTDALGSIHDILDRLTSKVSEAMTSEDSTNDRIENSAIAGDEAEDEEIASSNVNETKVFDDECPASRTESPSDDLDWRPYTPKKTRPIDAETRQKEMTIFRELLNDLSVSTFELAADSIDSLRDLASSLITLQPNEGRKSNTIPKCELTLARAMEDLVESLLEMEPKLKESTKKARAKLRREWTNFKDGEAAVCCSILEDQDASGDVKRGSNQWIIGSQGCPLLSSSETTLQTLSDSALSESDTSNTIKSELPEAEDRIPKSPETESQEDGGRKRNDKVKERRVGNTVEKGNSDESNDDENSNETQPQTRRVLRARGIPSYTEQFTSDDDDDAYELEEWPCVETLNATPSTSDGPSVANVAQKAGSIDALPGEKDSDQDWILPGARKRKNKRSPPNRRLKGSPQKSHSITGDSNDSTPVPPPIPEDLVKSKTDRTTKESQDDSFICKLESVHSELDIKDEGPIFEFPRNNFNPSNAQQNYPAPRPSPAFPRVNYSRVLRPPIPPPPGMMRQQMPPNYYVQGPQTYFDPRYIRYPSYPPPGRGGPPPYPYSPVPHQYPGPPNYWQPPNHPSLPPGMYAGPILRPPGYQTRGMAPQPRHQGPSTTLYGARLPNVTPSNRMPVSRPSLGPNLGPRAQQQPRPRGQTIQSVSRRYAPRNSLPPSAAARMPRPPRPNVPPADTNKTKSKTTSLILLSDSDDEIEMIVPVKPTGEIAKTPQNRKSATPVVKRSAVSPPKAKPRPVVTSQITVPKSNEILSPQMLQRMSQGGISITPVKPPASKQKPDENSQGTKLVVVVNDTGSHFALALPNGSKLILTPDQVAQIRASNGGKLVL